MLTKIALKNFKCFQGKTEFTLGRINLLTGVNGTGKSSFLQSLLLLYQSLEINPSTTELFLNGSCLKLGNYEDIKNSNTTRDEPIEIQYQIHPHIFENNQDDKLLIDLKYTLEEDSIDEMILKIKEVSYKLSYWPREGLVRYSEETLKLPTQEKYDLLIPNKLFKKLSGDIIKIDKKAIKSSYIDIIKKGFSYIHYISANRIGPRDFYLKEPLRHFPTVGANGENTINLLSKKAESLVNPQLCLGKDAQNLITQTEEWLSFIFDGAKLEVPKSNRSILEPLFNTTLSRNRYKASNVGFGYSYILPIIVSGLIAEENHILIVENPEAHLHPRAQSRLIEFLARVTAIGVQVFIETHSDHILNALRIAILDGLITSEQANILYFSTDIGVRIEKIEIKPDGRIEQWPKGFFDQMDLDFNRLFGV